MSPDRPCVKRVAIVGAGPSGLVAAKTLLEHRPPGLSDGGVKFEPYIFERRNGLGGLWDIQSRIEAKSTRSGGNNLNNSDIEDSRKITDGDWRGEEEMLDPGMRTNVSRFMVGFSDLDWSSVDLSDEELSGDLETTKSNGKEMTLPMFPKAWQVKKYIEEYARRYIPSKRIGLGCVIVDVERLTNHDEGNEGGKWIVKWKSTKKPNTFYMPDLSDAKAFPDGTHSALFDHIVIASGFFSRPSLPFLAAQRSPPIAGPVKTIHSSSLRSYRPLPLQPGGKGKIIVLGGSMSGVEAASSLAHGLSSHLYSPKGNSTNDAAGLYAGYEIHHLTTRPFWVIPPYVLRQGEKTNSSRKPPVFTPLDLAMFSLTSRPESSLTFRDSRQVPAETARAINTKMFSLLGTDQSDLAPDELLSFAGSDVSTNVPWTAISPSYSALICSGAIKLRRGRMVSLSDNRTVRALDSDGKEFEIVDVALLIVATGFSPHASLSFLPKPVLDLLEYKEKDNYSPLSLDDFGVWNPSVADMGFVGWYRGPFWGAMELQARYLARVWSDAEFACRAKENWGQKQEEKVKNRGSTATDYAETTADLLPRGQFPMADYVALIETVARELGVVRLAIPEVNSSDARLRHEDGAPSGPCIPARYPTANLSNAQEREVQKTLSSLSRTLGGSSQQFAGCAVFASLLGPWTLTRTLTSSRPDDHLPSGTFRGTATLHPRTPAAASYEGEYLYVEDGELATTQGLRFRATRRFVYRLGEADGAVTCWFVKNDSDDGGLAVDRLCRTLAFSPVEPSGFATTEGTCDHVWAATGIPHPCVEETEEHASSYYLFRFRGVEVRQWELRCHGHGPAKDHHRSSRAVYTRR